MIQQIEAVYEDGLLRPSHPLQLAQHERVRILVLPEGDDELFDPDFAMDESPDTAPSLSEAEHLRERTTPGLTAATPIREKNLRWLLGWQSFVFCPSHAEPRRGSATR